MTMADKPIKPMNVRLTLVWLTGIASFDSFMWLYLYARVYFRAATLGDIDWFTWTTGALFVIIPVFSVLTLLGLHVGRVGFLASVVASYLIFWFGSYLPRLVQGDPELTIWRVGANVCVGLIWMAALWLTLFLLPEVRPYFHSDSKNAP